MPLRTFGKGAIIYSVRSQDAVRALLDLARNPVGQCVTAQQLARNSQAPAQFLSATLGMLVRKGILRSEKGSGSGFALGLGPGIIRLLDIINAVKPDACYRRCAMGYPQCSENNSCAMHESWKPLRACILEYLNTSIAKLAKQV